MPTVTIKVRGLRELQGAFRQSPQIVEHHIQNAIESSMAELQKKALRPLIPWDTGRLLQSIGEGIVIGRLIGSIGPTVEYAQFVNRRGHRTGGKDFMGRWAKQAEKKVQGQFDKAVENISKDIVKRAKR